MKIFKHTSYMEPIRFIAIVCAAFFVMSARTTLAQTNACQITEFNLQRAVITCSPGFATGRDRVTVYAQNLSVDMDWPDSVNDPLPEILNGFWVFDAGEDGSIELIIRFTQLENGAAQAQLYGDIDGDGTVLVSSSNANGAPS